MRCQPYRPTPSCARVQFLDAWVTAGAGQVAITPLGSESGAIEYAPYNLSGRRAAAFGHLSVIGRARGESPWHASPHENSTRLRNRNRGNPFKLLELPDRRSSGPGCRPHAQAAAMDGDFCVKLLAGSELQPERRRIRRSAGQAACCRPHAQAAAMDGDFCVKLLAGSELQPERRRIRRSAGQAKIGHGWRFLRVARTGSATPLPTTRWDAGRRDSQPTPARR